MAVFIGEEPDVAEPSSYMSAMLQAGETTCPVCIDQIKHADPVCSIWNIYHCVIEIEHLFGCPLPCG